MQIIVKLSDEMYLSKATELADAIAMFQGVIKADVRVLESGPTPVAADLREVCAPSVPCPCCVGREICDHNRYSPASR